MTKTTARWRPKITQELLDNHRRTTEDGIAWWPVRMLYPYAEYLADIFENLTACAIETGVLDTPAVIGSKSALMRQLCHKADEVRIERREFYTQYLNFGVCMMWGSLSDFEEYNRGQWRWKSWSGRPQSDMKSKEDDDDDKNEIPTF